MMQSTLLLCRLSLYAGLVSLVTSISLIDRQGLIGGHQQMMRLSNHHSDIVWSKTSSVGESVPPKIMDDRGSGR